MIMGEPGGSRAKEPAMFKTGDKVVLAVDADRWWSGSLDEQQIILGRVRAVDADAERDGEPCILVVWHVGTARPTERWEYGDDIKKPPWNPAE